MAQQTAFNVILKQRFQTLEAERMAMEEQLSATQDRESKKDNALQEKTREMASLTEAFGTVQAEKIRLEFERERRQSLEALALSETAANGELAGQLKASTQQLAEALSCINKSTAEKDSLHTELNITKRQLDTKQSELDALQSEREMLVQDESTWKDRCNTLEAEMGPMQRRFDEKMTAWYQKEMEAVAQIANLTQERDALRVELQKKCDELKQSRAILKTTSDKFAECLAKDFKPKEKSNQASGQTDGGTEKEEHFTLSHLKLPDVDQFPLKRTSKAEFEPDLQFEGISFDGLTEKYSDLVKRFNEEVACAVRDEIHAEQLNRSRERALTKNRVLNFELSELSKIADARQRTVDELTEQVTVLKAELENERELREGYDSRLEASDKTASDYAAQVKFLFARLESEMRLEANETGAGLHVPSRSAVHQQPVCIHDVVEKNKELARENYRLQAECEELKAKIAQQTGTASPMEEIVPEYEEPDEMPSQKRVSAVQPGPSSKKQKMQSMEEAEADRRDSEWRNKWEEAQKQLSSTEAEHLQLVAQLRQRLEAVEIQNATYVDQLKDLDHRLVECQANLNARIDVHKHNEESFKAQMRSRNIRIKELDSVVQAMYKELDSAKQQLVEERGKNEMAVYKLEQEKKAYDQLQARVMDTEGQHVAEIEDLKRRYEAQIIENARNLTPIRGGVEGMGMGDMSAESVEHLRQQLREKDSAISELTRRLEAHTEPLNRERIYDLEAQIAMTQVQVSCEKSRADELEKALIDRKEQQDAELKATNDELQLSLEQMQHQVTEVEAEREAATLEMLRLSAKCDSYATQQENVLRDLEATKIADRETIQGLQARLLKEQNRTTELKQKLTEKRTELESHMAEIGDLKERLHKAEAQVAVPAQPQIETPLLVASEPKPDAETVQPVPMETAPVEIQPSEKPDFGESSLGTAPSTSVGTPVAATSEGIQSPVPVLDGEKRSLNFLLEQAKPKVHAMQSVQSTPQQNVDSAGAGAGSRSEGDKQDLKSPRTEEATEDEHEQTFKKQKWIPIVYSRPKKDDSGEDKKSDRGAKR